MKKNSLGNLLFNVFTPLLLGIIISFLFRNDFSYVETLNRNIKVPSFLFAVAWSILYVLMGIWYHLFDKEFDDQKIKSIYWISLFVNLMFTPILFSLNNLFLALVDVVVLFVLILYLFVYSLKRKKGYAYLLLPYICWLVVATILMIDLIINN